MRGSPVCRFVTIAAAGLLAVVVPTGVGEAAGSDRSLHVAVTGTLLQHTGEAAADRTRVTVTKQSGKTWVFGTAVRLAPHQDGAYPQGWLFLARRSGGTWQVGLEADPLFAELAGSAPVLTAAERRTLTGSGSFHTSGNFGTADGRTGMRLPYALGQSWSVLNPPHAWNSSDTVLSAIDLAGGDQVVRAARAGTAYTMCQGWVRVVHDGGYASDYYHLWNTISANGTLVAEGTRLGDIGTDVTCGGAVSGRRVQFGLRRNGGYESLVHHIVGKWLFLQPFVPSCCDLALHGSIRVGYSGPLYNYGALGFNQGIVDGYGAGAVNRHTGPGVGYPVAGTASDGSTVTIVCSANGTTHSGRFGTTSLWNRLTDGSWISDAHLATGVNTPVAGWC